MCVVCVCVCLDKVVCAHVYLCIGVHREDVLACVYEHRVWPTST